MSKKHTIKIESGILRFSKNGISVNGHANHVVHITDYQEIMLLDFYRKRKFRLKEIDFQLSILEKKRSNANVVGKIIGLGVERRKIEKELTDVLKITNK